MWHSEAVVISHLFNLKKIVFFLILKILSQGRKCPNVGRTRKVHKKTKNIIRNVPSEAKDFFSIFLSTTF